MVTARISTTMLVRFEPGQPGLCTHLDAIKPVKPSAAGCEDCLSIGMVWVHLRICMTCGHVGCCDRSRNRHARAHHERTGHMTSCCLPACKPSPAPLPAAPPAQARRRAVHDRTTAG